MKKIIILFNHFQIQDGVARCAVGMANALAKKKDIQVTLRPLFKFDQTMVEQLDERIIVRPVFGYYFRGFPQIVGKISMKWLHKQIIGNDYDIEIGLCMSLPIRIVSAYSDQKNERKINRFAWMHCYDVGLSLQSAYERIGKVICVSKYNADRLQKEANGNYEINYAYNLVDDTRVRKMGEDEIDISKSEYMQFVSVARMSPEKGYDRLLHICHRLKSEGYRFSLWLIGDGPQKDILEQKARQLEVGDVVSFLGEKTNPHAYTAKADVFICSSFDEGYSTACTEAIMLGTPVITTDVSGGKEIIDESECGMIVHKDNNEELYSALKTVLDNPQIVDEWKIKLRFTREKFSYNNRVEKLYKILGVE